MLHPRQTARALLMAAIFVSVGAGVASAETTLPTEPCRALLDSMAFVDPATHDSVEITRADERTCRFAPMKFSSGRFVGWVMDSLSVQGLVGADPGAANAVLIQAHGVRSAPPAANPVTAYLMKISAVPFDVEIDYASDPGADRLTLRHAWMKGPGIGWVEVDADLVGVKLPPTPLGRPPDVSRLGVTSLRLRVDNHGFVEKMIAPFVAGFVASGAAPQADLAPVIDARKAAVASQIRAMLPGYGVASETADALARFVEDFPHPTGGLVCTLAAERPIRVPVEGGPPGPAVIRDMVSQGHPACVYGPAGKG